MNDATDLKLWWKRFGVYTLSFLAVIGVALLLYAGSVSNDFVWDDPIVLNQQLQAFNSLHDIFFPPPRIPQFGRLYYRPLIILSYLVDRWLWGDTPFGFHFPVVVFHALNSGLVLVLGYRLFGKMRHGSLAALAGGVLFAAHPIHTESVCWMAGRSDTIAASFLLAALFAYLAWKRHRGERAGILFLLLAATLFLGGCLAKESALGFVFIIAAVDLLGIRGEGGAELGLIGSASPASGSAGAPDRPSAPRRGTSGTPRGASAPPGEKQGLSAAPSSKRPAGAERPARASRSVRSQVRASSAPRSTESFGQTLAGWAALGVACAIYFGMRSAALAAENGRFTVQAPNVLKSLEAVVSAVGFYISKIFVPMNLDAYIPKIPSPGLALLLGTLGIPCAVLVVLFAVTKGEKLVAFFFLWFFGALAPSLAIAYFVISEAPVAERYLYLPSIGFCLLAAYLALVKLPSLLPERVRRVAVAAAAVASLALAVVYGGGTIVRARAWKKDLDFWKDAVAKSPGEGLPRLHLGLAYANLNDAEMAEKEYRLAIDPSVDYDVEGRSTALNNLGMLYMGKGNYDQAEEFFERAIGMRPDYPTPHYGIGMTSMRRGETLFDTRGRDQALPYLQKSERYLRRAIELNPQYVKALNQMGYLMANTGRTQEAIQYFDKVLRLVKQGQEYDFAVKLRSQIVGRASS